MLSMPSGRTIYDGLLVDPVWSKRAGPVSFAGPRRVRAPGVRFDDLPAISLVLLSHNHYDHCDFRTLELIARRFHPPVVTPLGNGPLLRSAGFRQVETIFASDFRQKQRKERPVHRIDEIGADNDGNAQERKNPRRPRSRLDLPDRVRAAQNHHHAFS